MKAARKANIYQAGSWFQVLQTTKRSQTAVMTLGPGAASGDEPEAHEHSDQTLLVVSGQLAAQIGQQRLRLKEGDVVIVPPGVKHRFVNRGEIDAVTFSVYAPAAYPSKQRG